MSHGEKEKKRKCPRRGLGMKGCTAGKSVSVAEESVSVAGENLSASGEKIGVDPLRPPAA